jgi:GntR family transcriptional regulator
MITIDDDDPTPPYEQIRSQVADRIRVGELTGGSRLPSVRQLAGDLRLAAGTVARAYSALEAEGLIETSRTGARVQVGVALPQATRTAARRFVRALATEPVGLEEALSAVRAEWHARA